VNLLVEQIEGTLEVAADEGTSFKVKFPLSGTISGLVENGSSVYS
jgi:two-component sensor histidine kinase